MIERIFWEVCKISLWVIPVMVVLFAIEKKALGRYGARWLYGIWLLLAVRMLLPLPMVWENPLLKIPFPIEKTQETVFEMEQIQKYFEETEISWGIDGEKGIEETPVMISMEQENGIGKESKIKQYAISGLVVIWVTGMVTVLSFRMVQYRRFAKKLKRWRRLPKDAEVVDCYHKVYQSLFPQARKRPNVWICTNIESPMCFGIVKTEVYLTTETLDTTSLTLLFRHELCHYKRKDILQKCILFLLEIVYFWNPFVYAMSNRMEKLLEFSCDDFVMKQATTKERKAYSMLLLSLLQEQYQKTVLLSTTFQKGRETMKQRFENIFEIGNKKKGRGFYVIGSVLLCMSFGLVACTTTAPQEQQQTEESTQNTTEAAALLQWKTDFVGDNSAVGNLIDTFGMPEGVEWRGFAIQSDAEPYGIVVTYAVNDWAKVKTGESLTEDTQGLLEKNALVLFSLVENLEYVGYQFIEDDTEQVWNYKLERNQYGIVSLEMLEGYTNSEKGYGYFLDYLNHTNTIAPEEGYPLYSTIVLEGEAPESNLLSNHLQEVYTAFQEKHEFPKENLVVLDFLSYSRPEGQSHIDETGQHINYYGKVQYAVFTMLQQDREKGSHVLYLERKEIVPVKVVFRENAGEMQLDTVELGAVEGTVTQEEKQAILQKMCQEDPSRIAFLAEEETEAYVAAFDDAILEEKLKEYMTYHTIDAPYYCVDGKTVKEF